MPHLLKTICTTTLCILLSLAFFGQQAGWQQQVNFRIDVTLNDQAHTLDGFEKIEYINHSPDTLFYIWMHLWPNAYKNDQTAFSEQLLLNGSTKFYFSTKEQKGYINRLDLKADDITVKTEDHPQYSDIIKLLLPSPLLPGQKTMITTPFHVKLPYNFSRGGHVGQQYQVTQWYPKPAVYDKDGWHPMPYLDQGEFYNDFGNYEVTITVPQPYVVAATGNLESAEGKKWMLSHVPQPEIIEQKPKPGAYGKKPVIKKPIPENIPDKTLRFTQENVTDFAWFADKNFMVAYDTIQLADKSIDAYIYYLPRDKEYWVNGLDIIKKTIRTRSRWIGAYPYQTISVVDGTQKFDGGMEYPTITVISGVNDSADLSPLIEHEVGHNWFQAILQNNERRYPWMDEGFNTFYDNRFFHTQDNDNTDIEDESFAYIGNRLERLYFETLAHEKTDQPINTPSEMFSPENYMLSTYYKSAVFLSMLEHKIGRRNFDKGMQTYFQQYKFRHVSPADFQSVMEKTAGQPLDSLFRLLDRKGLLPPLQRKGWKIATVNRKSLPGFVQDPSKELLLISPAVGYNSYDKLMIGALFTNYKLPPSNFQFLAIPLFATGTKKLNGLGKLNYSFFPSGFIRKADLFINGSVFSMNAYKNDDDDKNTFLSYNKIVPGFRLTAKQKDPRKSLIHYLQWKTYLLQEDAFRFYTDTVISGTDTSYALGVDKTKTSRTLNQLKLVVENKRVLYPYDGELVAEQGKDFIRTTLTARYFFNYPKEGGLNLRFFAGKFFYTGGKTTSKVFSTDRYHLNMTGANGYEDYTYSNYFIGRNEFEGLESQQIMMRDGGFKVRTDLLSDKIGKSDDWLIAMNFGTTIPPNVNPLSVLPIEIPLRLYADIGTYSGAWKKEAATDHFLFDAGLHFPLFHEVLNIYVPLLYSNVYKDYLKSTIPKNRLLKSISFSLDFNKILQVKPVHQLGL